MASEAKRRANIEYNRRQDNIMIRPSKAEGAIIRAAAAAAGMSVQAYILGALRQVIGYDPASMDEETGTDTTDTDD